MNIAEYSVTKKVTTWLLIILFLAGGFTALQEISRLEDPEFTIKEAKTYTAYPGATPLEVEVEREVTYHIENAVQQLQQLKRVESISQDGFSEVTVVIKDKYKKADFPITPSCDPAQGLATELFERLRPQIEAVKLPPGYFLEWGGEYEDSRDTNAAIGSTLPAGFLAMIIVVILLFGKVRQPLIIWLTVPLAIIGITAGLLTMNVAFGFMGLLGALSLVGLLIKNAIILIEEIDMNIAAGKESYNAILDSAVSRMRPVMMAASTTILGMAPLLSDVFFLDMAVVIMFGLGFASVLTLIVVPVLYAIFFNIKPQT